jgi:hypothetical protein
MQSQLASCLLRLHRNVRFKNPVLTSSELQLSVMLINVSFYVSLVTIKTRFFSFLI